MKVLLTGAFGNLGTHTLRELLAQGHTVRCFDVATEANRRQARRAKGDFEVDGAICAGQRMWRGPCRTRRRSFTWPSSSPSCP